MDWAKAKSVLIFIFIALNIFLTANIGFQKAEKGVSRETLSHVEKILTGRNVVIKCKLPSYEGYSAAVSYESGSSFDKQAITEKLLGITGKSAADIRLGEALVNDTRRLTFKSESSFVFLNSNPKENIDISNNGKIEKHMLKVIGSLNLPTRSRYALYKNEKLADGNSKAYFYEKYDNFYIFGNYIEAVLSPKGLVSMECKFKKVTFEKDGKESEKVLRAYQVLISNIADLENSVITGIDLGFSANDLTQDTKGMWEKAVWRVSLEGKEPIDYNAIKGFKITNTNQKSR